MEIIFLLSNHQIPSLSGLLLSLFNLEKSFEVQILVKKIIYIFLNHDFFSVFFYGRSHIKGKQNFSITEQQHDKTNNLISVPSKDSDLVGHSDFYSFEPMGPSDTLDPN